MSRLTGWKIFLLCQNDKKAERGTPPHGPWRPAKARPIAEPPALSLRPTKRQSSPSLRFVFFRVCQYHSPILYDFGDSYSALGYVGNAISTAHSSRELSLKVPIRIGKSTKKIGKHKAFRRLLEDIRNQNRTFTVTATVPLPRRAVHRGGTPFSQGARERSATCTPNLRTYTFRRFGRKKKRSAVCGPTSSVKRYSAI